MERPRLVVLAILGLVLFAILFIPIYATHYSQAPVKKAGANDISLGPIDWGSGYSPGFPTSMNYPPGVNDIRTIYVKAICTVTEKLSIKTFIDGQDLLNASNRYNLMDCPTSVWWDDGALPLDSSLTHVFKLCWGITTDEVDSGSNCATVTIPSFTCKKYNEPCTIRSFTPAPQYFTNDCCGNSQGYQAVCATPIQSPNGQTAFNPVMSAAGSGICKRIVNLETQ